MAIYNNGFLKKTTKILKALSDISRLRAFVAISDRELCVCQIVELLGLAPSTVSKHLSILKDADLLATRKDGRWIYYSLNTESVDFPEPVLKFISASIANDASITEDRVRMKEILKIDPEELCSIQNKNTKRG